MSFSSRFLAAPLLAAGLSVCAPAGHSSGPPSAPPSSGPNGISIGRDAHGVAHVFATTDGGAYYGAGYAAAEDRLFQMCWMRLVVQGRLAEFMGPGNVTNPTTGVVKKTHLLSDRKARAFGWSKHAAKVVASMDHQTLALLSAYSNGVNAWINDPARLPDPLFAQFGLPIDPWTPADCIGAWLRLGEFFGTSGLDEAQLLHEWQILKNNPLLSHRQQYEQLVGTLRCDDTAALIQPSDVPQDLKNLMLRYAQTHGLANTDTCQPYTSSPHFSQAWAFAGSRTTTGHAVLVGDPRIGVTLPSQLYEWSMEGASFSARGVGVPGSPNILSGSTGDVAWSPTAVGFDQADLMLLKTDAQHPGSYELDGTWRNFTASSQETIKVHGEADSVLLYRESYFGPVVTAIVPNVHAGEEFASRRLPFYDPTDDPARGFIDLYRCGTVGTFFDALSRWTWPSVNLVFADSSGHIGYSVVGSVPVRNPVLDLPGIVAQDGSLSSSDWIDLLPQVLKPHVFDPAAGFVFSANHRPIGSWYPIPIRFGSGGSGDTFRSRRLRELLSTAPATIAPAQVYSFHHDVVSIAGRDFTEIGAWLKAHGVTLSADARRGLTELTPWMVGGATMDNAFRGTLVAANLDLSFRLPDAGPELLGRYGGGENGLNLFLKQALAKIHATPAVALTAAEIAYVDKVLADALRLSLTVGPTTSWQSWYQQHALTVQLPQWGSLEGFPSLTPGVSVPMGPFRAVDLNTLLSPLHQSYTQFLEMQASGKQFSVAPPGTAEPASLHSNDQIGLWKNEQFKPSPLTTAELNQAGVVSWKFL
ncbi:MAG TPA: penicillin acylase family protein [Planctomycetota bacterium]|nr:penicillin acylase family protein [Planctomycetota bacterium]